MSKDLPTMLRALCTSGSSMEREIICDAAKEIERLREIVKAWNDLAEQQDRKFENQ